MSLRNASKQKLKRNIQLYFTYWLLQLLHTKNRLVWLLFGENLWLNCWFFMLVRLIMLLIWLCHVFLRLGDRVNWLNCWFFMMVRLIMLLIWLCHMFLRLGDWLNWWFFMMVRLVMLRICHICHICHMFLRLTAIVDFRLTSSFSNIFIRFLHGRSVSEDFCYVIFRCVWFCQCNCGTTISWSQFTIHNFISIWAWSSKFIQYDQHEFLMIIQIQVHSIPDWFQISKFLSEWCRHGRQMVLPPVTDDQAGATVCESNDWPCSLVLPQQCHIHRIGVLRRKNMIPVEKARNQRKRNIQT